MRYEVILFDLDGTLIETPLSYIASVLNKVLSRIGQNSISNREAATFWFSPDIDGWVSKNPNSEKHLKRRKIDKGYF